MNNLPETSFLRRYGRSKPYAKTMKVQLLDGSGTREYHHLVEDVDRHGNTRIYFRRRQKTKIRIRNKPGSAEFDLDYRRAFALSEEQQENPKTVLPASLKWLCQRYMASMPFLVLDDSTRAARRSILDRVCAKHGHKRYMHLRPEDVGKLRDELNTTPEAANKR